MTIPFCDNFFSTLRRFSLRAELEDSWTDRRTNINIPGATAETHFKETKMKTPVDMHHLLRIQQRPIFLHQHVLMFQNILSLWRILSSTIYT